MLNLKRKNQSSMFQIVQWKNNFVFIDFILFSIFNGWKIATSIFDDIVLHSIHLQKSIQTKWNSIRKRAQLSAFFGTQSNWPEKLICFRPQMALTTIFAEYTKKHAYSTGKCTKRKIDVPISLMKIKHFYYHLSGFRDRR